MGESFTVYFHNDSVNGFQISDAYETHNMGIRYALEDYYFVLDLGIVTPDMHIYRNQFREANRSFGEIITLELGQVPNFTGLPYYYVQVKGAGRFGIDKLQDFAHSVLSLQSVNDINELVRMPSETWYGIGVRVNHKVNFWPVGNTEIKYDAYWGSDAIKLDVHAGKTLGAQRLNMQFDLGAQGILYDDVVSAKPVEADARKIIPYGNIRVDFNIGEYVLFVNERISLPTISSDNRLFAVLSAGITVEF